MGKNSFLLYTDMVEAVSLLTDEQLGQVFRAIFAYHCGKEYKCSDPTAGFYFKGTILPMFKRDDAKYECVSERRKNAAKIAAEARWRNHASGCETHTNASISCETMRFNASDADSDSVSDSDVSLETINKRENIKEKSELSLSLARTDADCDKELKEWFEKGNAPYIYKNFEHLATSGEFAQLKAMFPKTLITNTILAIENRADLRKKYKNLYLTLRNWLKKEVGNGTYEQRKEFDKMKRCNDSAEIVQQLISERES